MIPKEVIYRKYRADRYYRLEMKDYENIAYNNCLFMVMVLLLLNRGIILRVQGEIVRIYEYETLEMLIEDLRSIYHIQLYL